LTLGDCVNRLKHSYKPLTGQGEIRLLILEPGQTSDDITCSLFHVSLKASPIYEALSYAWGDPNDTCRIKCCVRQFAITTSLYSALKQLRQTSRQKFLWADALCIDQTNIHERSQQVCIMASIYAQAERVLIWLGDETEDVSKSFDSVTEAIEYFRFHDDEWVNESKHTAQFWQNITARAENDEPNIFKHDWTPILNLIHRPWFKRKWVFQELVKAREAILLCGERSLSWDPLADLVYLLQLHGITDHLRTQSSPFANYSDRSIAEALYNITIMHITRCNHGTASQENLIDLITTTRLFQSTDPRDQIIGILGLAIDVDITDDVEIQPDYSLRAEDYFKRVTIWSIMRCSSLRLLSCVGESPRPSEIHLPS
jgi:Heterokaryon incompatibility protein (HET)